jgi:hypothetical protein
VTGRSSRRRLRLRRKRKDESFDSKLSDFGTVEKSGGSPRRFDASDAGEAVEVVGHLGCCVIEAIGAAAALVAVLMVPAFLLMR